MTDNVRLLRSEHPVNDSAVEKLERALADARAGRTVAVAIAAVTRQGAARTAFSECADGVILLGAISVLQHRMADGLDAEGTEIPPVDEDS